GGGNVAAAWLQHPPAEAAGDRARIRGALWRPAPLRSGDAAFLQRYRRVHRRRDSQLRLPRAGGDTRHQRRARALPRLRTAWGSEGARDEETALVDRGSSRAAQARIRLQPGADGFGRDRLRRAQAEVRALP